LNFEYDYHTRKTTRTLINLSRIPTFKMPNYFLISLWWRRILLFVFYTPENTAHLYTSRILSQSISTDCETQYFYWKLTPMVTDHFWGRIIHIIVYIDYYKQLLQLLRRPQWLYLLYAALWYLILRRYSYSLPFSVSPPTIFWFENWQINHSKFHFTDNNSKY